MRVTGGLYRGHTILCPPGVIRPSMDRVRQSLFSILGNIEGISFLNLFSGSGVIGIEAASRGAAPVLLVEKEPRKKPTVLKNIAFVESHIDLVVDPVERFLKTSQRSGNSYSSIRRSISRARPLPWTNRAPPPTCLRAAWLSSTCTQQRSCPPKGPVSS